MASDGPRPTHERGGDSPGERDRGHPGPEDEQSRDGVDGTRARAYVWKSLASSPVVTVAFGAYGTLLAAVLFVATEGVVRPVHGVLALGFGVAAALWLRVGAAAAPPGPDATTDGQERETGTHPAVRTYVMAALLVAGFVGAYVVVATAVAGPAGRLTVVAMVYGLVLAVLFGVLNRPFVPGAPGLDAPDRRRYRTLHLTNFWRATQVVVSLFVAFGIGIAASGLQSAPATVSLPLGPDVGQLGLLTAGFGVGGLGLVLYLLAKFHFVTAQFVADLGSAGTGDAGPDEDD